MLRQTVQQMSSRSLDGTQCSLSKGTRFLAKERIQSSEENIMCAWDSALGKTRHIFLVVCILFFLSMGKSEPAERGGFSRSFIRCSALLLLSSHHMRCSKKPPPHSFRHHTHEACLYPYYFHAISRFHCAYADS